MKNNLIIMALLLFTINIHSSKDEKSYNNNYQIDNACEGHYCLHHKKEDK